MSRKSRPLDMQLRSATQTAQPDLCGFFRTFALDELEEKSLDASLHQTQIRSLLSRAV